MTVRHTYRDILERLAPCGVDCERCVRYEHGRIRRLSAELAAALEGFENMAPRVADHAPALQGYDRFVEVLDFLAGGDCAGCRAGGSELPFCATRTCFREMGVDFCFECSEYPCDKNSYPENLDRRWREKNDRMREVGVEQFYLESLEEPRY